MWQTLDIEKGRDAEPLGGLEGDGEVLDHLVLAALAEVEGSGLKVCDERAERKAVAPARVEVGHVHCTHPAHPRDAHMQEQQWG